MRVDRQVAMHVREQQTRVRTYPVNGILDVGEVMTFDVDAIWKAERESRERVERECEKERERERENEKERKRERKREGKRE